MSGAGNEALTREAADWFVRVHDESVTTEELNHWQRWLAQSMAHRQAFQAVEDFWQDAGKIEETPWPSIRELSEDDARARARRWPVRHIAALAAAVGVLAIAIGTLRWHAHSRVHIAPDSTQLATSRAEDRELALSDGSRITMGAQSQLGVALTRAARVVALESGEAFFKVTPDRVRPFVVHAGSGTITAIGTAFDVRHLHGRVVVTVTEGSVRVDDGESAPVSLKVGQQLAYGLAPAPVHAVDPNIATAWRAGRLKYLNEPLKYVIADIARYTHRDVTIADREVGEMLYTGTVLPDEVEDWVASVSDAFPVDALRDGRGAVLLKARSVPE